MIQLPRTKIPGADYRFSESAILLGIANFFGHRMVTALLSRKMTRRPFLAKETVVAETFFIKAGPFADFLGMPARSRKDGLGFFVGD